MPNMSLYERMLGAKNNNNSMSIDKNDAAILIELFHFVDQYINANVNYGLCDVERTCKKNESGDASSEMDDCFEEAFAVDKAVERLDECLENIGFYKPNNDGRKK